jgi:lipopolysaccharide/colanic/teichoic acid biosynthesis glycosyltransferase
MTVHPDPLRAWAPGDPLAGDPLHLPVGETLGATVSSAAMPPDASGYARAGKRSFDLAVSLFLLLTFLPVILVLVILVSLGGGGAPFFGHVRVGRGGRRFVCWKFRTMVPDAEARLATLLRADPEAAAEWARVQKLGKDPRVTPIGAFLRQTSLDELPQLWNVLRGEMSLVGPRPVTRAEIDRYGEAASDYLAVRPGITGLWQVQGRSSTSYEERVRMDRLYVRTVSFRRDLEILLATLPEVLARTGR